MDRAWRAIWRYRWELTPLVLGSVMALAFGLLVQSFFSRGVALLAAAVILALLLRGVLAQHRPLLTALWLLSLAKVASDGLVQIAVAELRDSLHATQLGFLYTAGGGVTLVVVLALAAWLAPRGMRFAILMAALFFAPTDVLVVLTSSLRAAFAVGELPFVIGLLLPVPVSIAGLITVAYVVRHGEDMAPRRFHHAITLLLVLGFLRVAGISIPLLADAILNQRFENMFGLLFYTPAIVITQMALILGLTWLVASLRLAAQPKVRNG